MFSAQQNQSTSKRIAFCFWDVYSFPVELGVHSSTVEVNSIGHRHQRIASTRKLLCIRAAHANRSP